MEDQFLNNLRRFVRQGVEEWRSPEIIERKHEEE